MRRETLHVGLFVVLVVFTIVVTAAGETQPTEDGQVTIDQEGTPQAPEGEGNSSGTELEPGPDGPERQALDRIARKFDRRIRELEELASQVKGMELVDLQRRIVELKRRRSEEELSARVELAREAGDERRLRQLEQLSAPSKPPVTPPEVRPVPAPAEDDGKGGER